MQSHHYFRWWLSLRLSGSRQTTKLQRRGDYVLLVVSSPRMYRPKLSLARYTLQGLSLDRCPYFKLHLTQLCQFVDQRINGQSTVACLLILHIAALSRVIAFSILPCHNSTVLHTYLYHLGIHGIRPSCCLPHLFPFPSLMRSLPPCRHRVVRL